MFSTMTSFYICLQRQSVSKIVAQFIVDAFEDIKCNMYILHHITCNWTKFVGAGTLYVLAFHKFLTLRIKKHRKNCECCHRHSLFKGHNVNVNIVVLN